MPGGIPLHVSFFQGATLMLVADVSADPSGDFTVNNVPSGQLPVRVK